MTTLTETIAEELLDCLDDPDGIERVMTQHRGSKGPLYGGLARATMWLHQHVQELNDRAGRLKADNETLGEKVAALAQQRSVLEEKVGLLDNRVDQASARLHEIEKLVARADELQALGFGQPELKTMSETLAGIGSDPTKAVVTFLATVNEYQSLDALTRGQSEEEAKLQDLRSQFELLKQAAGPDRLPFVGDADQIAGDIRQYQDMGVTSMIWDFLRQTDDLDSMLGLMEDFSTQVWPKV